MNREQLVTQVSRDIDLPKTTVDRCLSGVIQGIKDALLNGDEVKIREFGTFEAVEHRARKGVNPRTGESIDIPAKSRVKFKAAEQFDDLVN